MPQATIGRDNVIDHVVPLDDLAGLLLTMAAPQARRMGGGRAGP